MPTAGRSSRISATIRSAAGFSAISCAIATYRHALSEIVPELTRVAWRTRKEEISRLTPGIEPGAFIYRSYAKSVPERMDRKQQKRAAKVRHWLGMMTASNSTHVPRHNAPVRSRPEDLITYEP
jgi:hypothetical protein